MSSYERAVWGRCLEFNVRMLGKRQLVAHVHLMVDSGFFSTRVSDPDKQAAQVTRQDSKDVPLH